MCLESSGRETGFLSFATSASQQCSIHDKQQLIRVLHFFFLTILKIQKEKTTFFWNICHFRTFFHKGTLKTAKWAPGICCPQEIVSPPLQTRDARMWEGSAGTSGRQKTAKSQRTPRPMAAKTTGKVRAGAITPSCPGQFPPFFQSEARPVTHVPTETTHKDSEMLPTQHRAALTARTAIS